MISVIVCSVNPELLARLRLNVEATIETSFEILAFDNKEKKRGIAEVYNELVQKAGYEILCFVHEDIIIRSNGWGVVLEKLLADKKIGLVGISGAVYKSKYSGTWSACHPSLYRTHSIQHFKHEATPIITNINPGNASYAEVAVIDGVFMATRKEIFNQYSFDEKMLKGFHGYDIDYSLQVGQHYKLAVTYEVLLEHLSEGKLSDAWLKNNLPVHKKWKQRLPVQTGYITNAIKKESDYKSSSCALGVALQHAGNKKLVMEYFIIILFKFFSFNKFRYGKSVLNYLLNNSEK